MSIPEEIQKTKRKAAMNENEQKLLPSFINIEVLDKDIRVRLTKTQLKHIKNMAKKYKLSSSSFIRCLIDLNIKGGVK